MPEIKPEIETIAKIKVVGVGGSGGSAINRMIDAKLKGVDFIAVNTDAQALSNNQARLKVRIGQMMTKGLGAGMNPDVGAQSAQESINDIREALRDANMVFIACGLGGGTGTGAAPVVATVARELGALVVAVVTKPFAFEGKQRMEIADRGLKELRDKVDAIITIPNDKILQIIDKKTSLLDSFKAVDDVLRQGIQGISEIITVPALINIDFADVKAVMQGAGSALMGIGEASGENRAVQAAKMAISSPLLDLSIDGARGVMFVITGDASLTMNEVNEAAQTITESSDPSSKRIFGVSIDERLKDKIKITVVATGFGDKDNGRSTKAEENKYSMNRLFTQRPIVEDEPTTDVTKPATKSAIRSIEQSVPTARPIAPVVDDEDDLETPTIFRRPRPSNVAPATKPADDEDLDIPAFLRKRMK